MSVDIAFYFNAPGMLREVAQAADGALECRFVPYEGSADDLFCRFSIGLRVPVPDSALVELRSPL
jgi:hypothetical protein